MAKKPRSQRRKKGKGSDAEDDVAVSKADALSDTHTVDGSVGLSLFEDDYTFGGKY